MLYNDIILYDHVYNHVQPCTLAAGVSAGGADRHPAGGRAAAGRRGDAGDCIIMLYIIYNYVALYIRSHQHHVT
jgi:hypothetical protein